VYFINDRGVQKFLERVPFDPSQPYLWRKLGYKFNESEVFLKLKQGINDLKKENLVNLLTN
jgi:hypothetical protein